MDVSILDVIRRVLDINKDGYRSRGSPKKRWMNCLKDDMSKEVSAEMTADTYVNMCGADLA